MKSSHWTPDRRTFLKVGACGLAGLGLNSTVDAAAEREVLYNGIVLGRPWPPRYRFVSPTPITPPYLADPPAVIDIDVGRQLFVDDFLIEEATLTRTYHRADYHPASPVLAPDTPWERRDERAERLELRKKSDGDAVQ